MDEVVSAVPGVLVRAPAEDYIADRATEKKEVGIAPGSRWSFRIVATPAGTLLPLACPDGSPQATMFVVTEPLRLLAFPQ